MAETAFRAEGLTPRAWSNEAGFRYGIHTHAYDKVLVCVRGSITFRTEKGDIYLEAGDRMDLPAGTKHEATVGPDGVICWEAPREGPGARRQS